MQDRLLLVDDDTSLLKLLGIRLEAEGFAIESATSAAEALQLLRNIPVDLVLTDLRMEGESGLDLFTQVRHFYPGLPVIIMSAQGTIPEAVSATQMGVFEFLTKPVDKKVLLSTVRAALEQSGVALIAAGMLTTVIPVLFSYFFGRKVLKINPVLLLGALTGAMSSGACLSIVNKEARSTIPSLGYTGAFAFANILLTVAGSLILLI